MAPAVMCAVRTYLYAASSGNGARRNYTCRPQGGFCNQRNNSSGVTGRLMK